MAHIFVSSQETLSLRANISQMMIFDASIEIHNILMIHWKCETNTIVYLYELWFQETLSLCAKILRMIFDFFIAHQQFAAS